MAKILDTNEYIVSDCKDEKAVRKAIEERFPAAKIVDISKEGKKFTVRVTRDVGDLTPATS